MPEVHFDFMFVGQKNEPGETVTCLVVREALTSTTLAVVVPSKSTGSFVVKRVIAFLDEVGCMHIDMIVRRHRSIAT